ncbi:MAG: hypothetical protein RLZZ612_327 [Pseudomonadota bacterium]|jgi:hypothetical protein
MEQPQVMTYQEREQLKRFASKGENLKEAIVMIAHWMRQTTKISFSEYASNWAVAHNIDLMKKEWPLTGKRKIADNYSDWDSFKG